MAGGVAARVRRGGRPPRTHRSPTHGHEPDDEPLRDRQPSTVGIRRHAMTVPIALAVGVGMAFVAAGFARRDGAVRGLW